MKNLSQCKTFLVQRRFAYILKLVKFTYCGFSGLEPDPTLLLAQTSNLQIVELVRIMS